MRCQQCGKPASEHVTVLSGWAYAEVHLCAECEATSRIVLTPEIVGPVRCDRCGSTLHDIEKRGSFGCENDYRLFAMEIAQCLKNYHGTSKHVGKTPAVIGGF